MSRQGTVFLAVLTFNYPARKYVDSQIIVIGSAWTTDTIATVGLNNAREGVRQSVAEEVNLFLNDWLAANPKGSNP